MSCLLIEVKDIHTVIIINHEKSFYVPVRWDAFSDNLVRYHFTFCIEQAPFFNYWLTQSRQKRSLCCPFYTIAVQCAQTERAKKVNDYELNSWASIGFFHIYHLVCVLIFCCFVCIIKCFWQVIPSMFCTK